jgi:hypothetical protein
VTPWAPSPCRQHPRCLCRWTPGCPIALWVCPSGLMAVFGCSAWRNPTKAHTGSNSCQAVAHCDSHSHQSPRTPTSRLFHVLAKSLCLPTCSPPRRSPPSGPSQPSSARNCGGEGVRPNTHRNKGKTHPVIARSFEQKCCLEPKWLRTIMVCVCTLFNTHLYIYMYMSEC